MSAIVGDSLHTAGPVEVTPEHDNEQQTLCAICNAPARDYDVFIELCCPNFIAHRTCVAAQRRRGITVKCQTCVLQTTGLPQRRAPARLSCAYITVSVVLPILIMMTIVAYLAPPYIHQWYFKRPYVRGSLAWITTDMMVMFVLEAISILTTFIAITCCVCCSRGFVNALCCCCQRTKTE